MAIKLPVVAEQFSAERHVDDVVSVMQLCRQTDVQQSYTTFFAKNVFCMHAVSGQI